MDKIVIVTRYPDPDHPMIRCLSMLFPECELRVVSKEVETSCEGPGGCSFGPFTSNTTRNT
jgi:hypothetical protein